MKRLKQKQLGPYCSWCSTRAVIRSDGMTYRKYCCEQHKDKMKEHENMYQDDGHLTEADYQTWMKL